jgi:DNA-binding MarR family transcriptional regulator
MGESETWKGVTTNDLSKNQLSILRHMLGMDSDTPGYRNWFIAGQDHWDHSDLVQLELMGLVSLRLRNSDNIGRADLWRATPKGRELVGAPAVHEKRGGGDDG